MHSPYGRIKSWIKLKIDGNANSDAGPYQLAQKEMTWLSSRSEPIQFNVPFSSALSFLYNTYIMSVMSRPSALPPRSTRTRIKSQRAIDSEFTDRLFSKPKDKLVAIVPAVDEVKGKTKGKRAGPGKKKGKKEDVYCLCRSNGSDERPMIECGACSDW